MNGIITKAHATAEARPRVMPARVNAKMISTLLSGGISKSTIFPCTLDIKIDDELFINAF